MARLIDLVRIDLKCVEGPLNRNQTKPKSINDFGEGHLKANLSRKFRTMIFLKSLFSLHCI